MFDSICIVLAFYLMLNITTKIAENIALYGAISMFLFCVFLINYNKLR